MAPEDPSNPFWGYSLRLYGSGEVAPLCLRLQDGWGLDVNLLLYCLWRGAQGHSLSLEGMARISTPTAAWRQEVVEPLRKTRRWLKGRDEGVAAKASGLRDQIKALELAAEKCQQDWLADQELTFTSAPAPLASAKNLALYLEQEAVTPNSELIAVLARLLTEAFPQLPREAFVDALAEIEPSREDG